MSKSIEKSSGKKILISGASIAGLTAAYWLDQYGFDVTVVERSRFIRTGGYPIDLQGKAIDIIERMGLLSILKKEHINTEKISFIHPDGSNAGVFRPELISNNNPESDLEMPRGKLVNILYQQTQQDQSIDFHFNDSISDIEVLDTGVRVTFKNDWSSNFNFVIGADGIHSNTRRIIFGEKSHFLRDLGYSFCGFSIPNDFGYYKEVVIYATPGRAAMLYTSEGSTKLHVLLAFKSEYSNLINSHDITKQHELVSKVFSNDGWKIPYLLTSMRKSNDFYYDVIGQIHMNNWFKGRIALVGDASYAPSFISGQGSSLAMIGGYILAEEMASHEDYKKAFLTYEKRMVLNVNESQDKAINSASFLIPTTDEELKIRNQILSTL